MGGGMTTLRILLTNDALADRGGSDLYVRDVATALLERGHRPFGPLHGTVADELRLATIPVIDNGLGEVPNLYHGHHHLETMSALLQFPRVSAIYFCHGWLPPEEAPPRFPRILRYVAVDDVCRDRLVCEHGVPEDRIEVHLNFVGLRRFVSRHSQPVPHARSSSPTRCQGAIGAGSDGCGHRRCAGRAIRPWTDGDRRRFRAPAATELRHPHIARAADGGGRSVRAATVESASLRPAYAAGVRPVNRTPAHARAMAFVRSSTRIGLAT